MDWGSALAQGIGAAANTGANIIGDRMKQDAAAQAEQRAADIKLDTTQRMLAIEEAMKSRAAERFSSVVQAKLGEELPVDAPTVPETGLTRDSAVAAGTGPGFANSASEMAATMRRFQAVLADPNATDEQKADARGVMDQITRQVDAQVEINSKSVEGKTRHRTTSEAAHAALDATLATDPLAYIAGTGMLGSVLKDEAAEKSANLKERLATSEAQRKEKKDDADRASRETIADGRDAQREKAADQRFEALMARLGPDGKGKAGQKSGTVQTLEFLRDELGWSKDQIGAYLTQSKHASVEDIYLKLKTANDKAYGDASDEDLMERARSIANMAGGAAAPAAASSSSSSSNPKVLNYDPKTGNFK